VCVIEVRAPGLEEITVTLSDGKREASSLSATSQKSASWLPNKYCSR